jgi:hypothetical protein
MAAIAKDRALEIATDHAAQVPLGHPDYSMGCELSGRVGDDWLFAYRIRCLKDIPADAQEQFAGAGGFLISADGKIRDLSVPMFIEAKRKASP